MGDVYADLVVALEHHCSHLLWWLEWHPDYLLLVNRLADLFSGP